MEQYNVYLDGVYQFTTVGDSVESVLKEINRPYGPKESNSVLTGRIALERSPISFNYNVIPTKEDNYKGDLILDYIIEDGNISQISS